MEHLLLELQQLIDSANEMQDGNDVAFDCGVDAVTRQLQDFVDKYNTLIALSEPGSTNWSEVENNLTDQ